MSFIINRDTKVYISTVDATETFNFNDTNTRKFNALKGIEYNVPSGITNHSRDSLAEDHTRNTTPYTQSVSKVTFSIPIYFKPFSRLGNVDCVENFFWQSFSGKATNVSPGLNELTISFDDSRVAQLPFIQVFLYYGDKLYKFKNSIIEGFDIPIDIDKISASIVRGSAQAYEEVKDEQIKNALLGVDRKKSYPGDELDNIAISKYSVLSLTHNGVSYDLPLTGGSISLDNNVSYNSRPKVGSPAMFGAHYTGPLTVDGYLKCYLKAGTNKSSEFLQQRLEEIRSTPFEEVFSTASLKLGNKNIINSSEVELNLGQILVNAPNFSNSDVVNLTFQFITKDTENLQILYRL